MKLISTLICVFLLTPLIVFTKACDITIQSTWKNLETPRETERFGSEWILTAIITFRRTPELKEPLCLHKLQFAWKGPELFNLSASLYKKLPNKDFMPIEDALICDGQWNNTLQQITFHFEKEEHLTPVTKFYIVVAIPDSIAQKLQQGNFHLLSSCLPEELQEDFNTENTPNNNIIIGLSFTVQPGLRIKNDVRIA